MEMPNSLGILHGDAKFSREFCVGCQIPCSVGDTKITEGGPKSLGHLTWGCQILGGARYPMSMTTECELRCHVNMGTPDFRNPGSPKLYRFGDPVPKST